MGWGNNRELRVGKDFERGGRGLSEAIRRPRFEPGIFRIQFYNVINTSACSVV